MKTLNLTTALTRSFVLGGIATIAALTVLSREASAQYFFKGDAYGAKVNINASVVNVVGVGVGATIVDNTDLPLHGSNSALTGQLLNAEATASLLAPLATYAVLDASVINTSTIGPETYAQSVATITGLHLFPSLTFSLVNPVNNLLPNLNLNLGSNSIVSADLIRSTTYADAFGNNGRTQITNLRIGSTNLGNLDITDGTSVTYYMNLLGQASLTPSAVVLVPDLARIVINKQTVFNGIPTPESVGKTRTTDAISVDILQHARLANASVVVASSTAGFAVPESGTMTYALSAGLLLAGPAMIRLRRRAKN